MRSQDNNKLEIGLNTYENDHEARSYRKRERHPAIEKHSSINIQNMNKQVRKPRENFVTLQERDSITFVPTPSDANLGTGRTPLNPYLDA
jgi:hypothetical protein